MNQRNERNASLLVVDDTPANLQLLIGMLKDMGYQVRPTMSGKQALQAARSSPPDLVLLDVTMPEMNGYQVCEQLKADADLRDIPVIFISALNETLDKVRAFSVGGVDYITKPFQIEEVEVRVRTQLHLSARTRALQEAYTDLDAAHKKLQELQHQHDDLVHMIVHDLRTPLGGIHGYLQLIQESEPDITQEGTETINELIGITANLLEMVSSILDVSKMEAGAMNLRVTSFDLREVILNLYKKLAPLSGERTMNLECRPETTSCLLEADEGLISRTLGNLISNAIKFTPQLLGEIHVTLDVQNDVARIRVCDNGTGIPEEYRDS